MPQDFCLKNNIERYQYAVFYFDGTIAASLSCADFFRAFGLDAVRLAGRYPYTVSQTEEGKPLYVINLADRV